MWRSRTGKYNARKTIVDGIKFDSQAEAEMYIVLKQWEKQGKIRDLKTQVEFTLQPGFTLVGKKIRPITYRADFTFWDKEKDKYRVIDCKGMPTPVYKLKRKMFDFINHGSELSIEESI